MAQLRNDRLVQGRLDVVKKRDKARSRNLSRSVLAVQAEDQNLLARQDSLRTSVTSPKSKVEVESLRICRMVVGTCDYNAPGVWVRTRVATWGNSQATGSSAVAPRELDTYRSVPLRCRYQSPTRFENVAGTHLPGDMIGATRGRFGAATEQDNIIFAS